MLIPDPYLEIPRGLSSPKDLWALLVKSLRPRSLVMEAALAPYQWKLGGFFSHGNFNNGIFPLVESLG